MNYKDLSAAGYRKGKNVRGHGAGAFAETGDPEADKDIFFTEAEYFVYPWLQPYVSYEHLGVDGSDDADKAGLIAGTVLLAHADVKFKPVEADGGDKNNDKRITAFR